MNLFFRIGTFFSAGKKKVSRYFFVPGWLLLFASIKVGQEKISTDDKFAKKSFSDLSSYFCKFSAKCKKPFDTLYSTFCLIGLESWQTKAFFEWCH